jgi:hypothetical protein
MWDTLKTYLMEMGIKKYLPIAVMAGFSALGGLMLAHAGVLEQYGVTYGNWPFHWPVGQEPSGNVILIELDTLSKAAITGIAALIGILIRAAQHHSTGSPVTPQAIEPPKA